MLSFKEYTGINQLRKAWNNLISEDSDAIYQTYSFNKILLTAVMRSKAEWVRRVRYGNKPIFVVASEDGCVKCIAPLMLINTPNKVIYMLGYNTNAGYLDFIYRESEYVAPTVEYIQNKYPLHTLHFNFVPEKSALCNIGTAAEEFGNYAITVKEYNDWFAGLSKSTRQNIRTAYNRLKTDEHEWSLKVYSRHSPELNKKIYRVNDIYWKRKVKWTGQNSEYSYYERRIFPKKDPIYQSLRKKQNSILAVLNIDDQEAAFFVGLQYNKGICIPRLAIHMDYMRYSPGLVLINEFIKQVQIEDYYVFDLCRGEEGYKTVLQAERSKSFRMNI